MTHDINVVGIFTFSFQKILIQILQKRIFVLSTNNIFYTSNISFSDLYFVSKIKSFTQCKNTKVNRKRNV